MNDVVKKRFQFTTRDLLLGTAIVALGLAAAVAYREPFIPFVLIGSGVNVVLSRRGYFGRIVLGALAGFYCVIVCMVIGLILVYMGVIK